MKVYALVGKRGTGKSFQSMNLCRELNIETIIDDGLFISGPVALAGTSAKGQKTKVAAIKTAIFTDPAHRKEVSNKIKEVNPDSILIIGTSDKMVEQIREALEIPPIGRTIYIEDITTEEERETAQHSREELGKHVVPVPKLEIKKDLSGRVMDSLLSLVGRGAKSQIMEKTVVRPTYSMLGDFDIDSSVYADIVAYLAAQTEEVVSVDKAKILPRDNGVQINLKLTLKYGVSIPEICRRIQQQITSQVHFMTAENIDAVNIIVATAR